MLKNLFSKIRPTPAETPPSGPEEAALEPPVASQPSPTTAPVDVEPRRNLDLNPVPAAVESPSIEATDAPASLVRAEEERNPTPEEISALAYTIWKDRGMPIGTDHENWIEAERQLRERRSHPS